MTPRNLSLANQDTPPLIGDADRDSTTANAEDIRVWLLGCAGLGTLVGLPYTATPSGTSIDAYFREGEWLCRAITSFARVRQSIAAGDAATIQTWLLAQADYMERMLQTQLGSVLPNRANDDYTVRTGFAFTPGGQDAGVLARQGGVQLSRISLFYNNRRANMVMAVWLAGEHFGIPAFKEAAKRYVREWVIFSVYPNGDQGEWSRADDYGYPEQGFVYCAKNLAVAFEVASRAALEGDFSLLRFATRDGAYATVSPSQDKTIWTAYWLYVRVLNGLEVFITPAGNRVQLFRVTGSNQRRMHWSFMLPPLARLGAAAPIAQQLRVPTPGGWSEDFGETAWAGVCSIYPTDTRVGVNAPALAIA